MKEKVNPKRGRSENEFAKSSMRDEIIFLLHSFHNAQNVTVIIYGLSPEFPNRMLPMNGLPLRRPGPPFLPDKQAGPEHRRRDDS